MKPQDIQDLKELIELLKHYQVADFHFERDDTKVSLKFERPEPSERATLSELARLIGAAPHATSAASHPSWSGPAVAGADRAPVSEPAVESLHLVKSPIVGTFYSSPSPGAPPFVSPGDRVEKGQVICIVEAMKLMNEIEADASGEIVSGLVTNGQPIEFGQPLFSIRQG